MDIHGSHIKGDRVGGDETGKALNLTGSDS
jgi:hypothetical protein